MQPEFWLQRWQQGQIGFHRGEGMPLLERHWPALQVAPGGRVLVPLCGKSLDMHWLAAQGHRVLGVEISPLAVQQFFAEAGLRPERRSSALGEHFSARSRSSWATPSPSMTRPWPVSPGFTTALR